MPADDVLNEINGVKKYIQSRGGLRSLQVNSSLIDSFTLTAVKMVSMCSNFGPHAASQLTDALASDSPYGDAGTKAIVTAIESRLNSMTGLTRGQQQKGCSQSQLLKCWWNYLTVSDWDFIKDTKQHFSAKLTRMVERANLLGLVSFDEHTYKWMLAVVLVAHYDQLPASADVFSKLQELKRVRAMERKSYPHEFITKYPASPNDLRDAMYSYAYATEKPVVVEIPGINAVAMKIPLRSNSVLLKNAQKGAGNPMLAVDWQPVDAVARGVKTESEPVVKKEILSSSLPGLLLASPTEVIDCDEKDLLAKYQADLASLRASKASSASPQTPAASTASSSRAAPASIELRDAGDGKMTLKPLVIDINNEKVGDDKYDTAKCHEEEEEEEPSPEDSVLKRPAARTGAKPPSIAFKAISPSDAELTDPFAQEAVAALQSRNKTRKEANKKDVQENKQDVQGMRSTKQKGNKKLKTAKGNVTSLVKREAEPAAAVSARKDGAATGAKRGLEPIVEIPKSKILKAMPCVQSSTGTVKPVHYWGGVIYTVARQRKFRALRQRDDKYSECSATWGNNRSQQDAWAHVTKSIEDYQKSGKSKRK